MKSSLEVCRIKNITHVFEIGTVWTIYHDFQEIVDEIFNLSPINRTISKKTVQFVVYFPKIAQVGEKSPILSRFISPINCEIISR